MKETATPSAAPWSNSMTEHSITPPPELVHKWIREESSLQLLAILATRSGADQLNLLATRAAQWGADQELRAVCQLLFSDPSVSYTLSDIRAARRPKPPSLKEQALAELAEWENVMDIAPDSPIRRALEALPE